jgi:hypothetical protein
MEYVDVDLTKNMGKPGYEPDGIPQSDNKLPYGHKFRWLEIEIEKLGRSHTGDHEEILKYDPNVILDLPIVPDCSHRFHHVNLHLRLWKTRGDRPDIIDRYEREAETTVDPYDTH